MIKDGFYSKKGMVLYMKATMLTMIFSSLMTLLSISIIRDIKYYVNKNKYIKEHEYKVGDKVIVKQENTKYNRLVGCEILELRRHNKDQSPYYKVKAYIEGLYIWILPETSIQCTADEFGSFPNYNETT